MITDSTQVLDNIFLSYNQILERLHSLGLTTKNGNEISNLDLRAAINIMIKKHSTCRWRSERIRNRKYFVLVEGYYWLTKVYFQKEKSFIDADIDFFKKRIKQYEDLLKISYNPFSSIQNMNVKELEEYFLKEKSTIRKAIRKMCNNNLQGYKKYIDGKVVINKEGVEWLCKNCFKTKYLEILENYKMKLTEKYIEAGYPYDEFFGLN